MKKYNVNFINQNIEVSAAEGTILADICRGADIPLNMVCGGRGKCGKCAVEIEEEGKRFTVLACNTSLDRDINIYLQDEHSKDASILESMNDFKFILNPLLKKTYKSMEALNTEGWNEILKNCPIDVLRDFSKLINRGDSEGITFVIYDDEVIDIQPGYTSEVLYGAAVDIGTTTVVMYVYDMRDGKSLGIYSAINSQFSLGADVISRISHAESDEGLEELHEKIIHTLNELLQSADTEIPKLRENLYNIVLCGNSTMQHLFLKLKPGSLGKSPFMSIAKGYVELSGKDAVLNCVARCRIVFLPILGGFVGADTTSVLLTLDEDNEDNKERLIIDLGTNGEIAAGSGNTYCTASAACGPALEGGNIVCGMRGMDGAVERIEIYSNGVFIKTIGGGTPLGICGSGIVDAVAGLLRNNIIDSTGRMCSRDEYRQMNPYSRIGDNLTEIDGINSFVIYEDKDRSIYVNQKDIRQIQLAKSSIYSGCAALLSACGKDVRDIDEVLVAGAFGNYIDIENAAYIGLLPGSASKIRAIGNGAGKGASMFLLDRSMGEKCDKITENSTHMELADNIIFAHEFIDNMNFKK